MTEDTGRPARAHQRRVTLNLIRHSAVASPELRDALNALSRADWDFGLLDKGDIELIFAQVDDRLADAAREEFSADLKSIRDLKRSPRPGNPDCECILCGHHHIRWEFDLINKVDGGMSTKTGSTCIVEYGLNIDGYGSAEAALQALRDALSHAQREADRAEWREEHEDHVEVMASLAKGEAWLKAHYSPQHSLYKHLRPLWRARIKALIAKIKAANNYYVKWGYLTPLQTQRVFGPDSAGNILTQARDFAREFNQAEKAGGVR